MTKQEADFIGSMNMCDEISNEAYKKIMCHCVEESQPCEDCIQTSFEEWLSSFNTESAPQCFNAVQELKKQIEKKQNT